MAHAPQQPWRGLQRARRRWEMDGRTNVQGVSGIGVWDRHTAQPAMGYDAAADEHAALPAMGGVAVGHGAAVDERTVGEGRGQ
jgi:hypothetical protein